MTEPTPFDKLAFTWEAAFTTVDAARRDGREVDAADVEWVTTMRPQLADLRARVDAGEDLAADFDTMVAVMNETQSALRILSTLGAGPRGDERLAEFDRLRAQTHTVPGEPG